MVRRPASLRSSLLAMLVFCLFEIAAAHSGASVAGETPGSTKPDYDASRIISIGGSITEILYALGVQQRIIAVDTTSLYPPNALKDKPNVGYMRQLSAEGVLGLSPTLILAIEGSGPHETVDVLERAKVPFIIIPDRFSAEGVIDKIRIISADVGVPQRGECLVNMVRRDVAALATRRDETPRPVKVAFLLSLANGRPVIAGRGTAADGIIRMAGGTNAFDDFEGYKPVNDESIAAARPDAVLAMDRGEHALSAETVFSEPGLALTPAAEHKTLITMDGLYLLGFGPRTVRAARDLAAQFYPKIAGADLPSERSSSATACDQ
jgi:iron complex transport system substrate-binding protein